MSRRGHSWSVSLSWQQIEVVQGVNDPLWLHILLVRVKFTGNGSIDYVVGHLMLLEQFVVVLSQEDASE